VFLKIFMKLDQIRNFCIIAHIDHGKSTLADRFLELTATIPKNKMRAQFLDQMDLERERGITIKLQPVKMVFKEDGKEYIYNLIDTPGHVDFAYEVSRSLAVCEGALLLVDATQGVQAQTLANLSLAKSLGLDIIPVINKIDSSLANIDQTKIELESILGKNQTFFLVSAKSGQGVGQLLSAIKNSIRPPGVDSGNFRAIIFDSFYDPYQGVIAVVKIVAGEVAAGQAVRFLGSETDSEISQVGYFKPTLISQLKLTAGEIGYLVTGLKSIRDCRVGDTIVNWSGWSSESALPGFKEPQAVVFSEFYAKEANKYEALTRAIEKLRLNDASLSQTAVSSRMLGFGFRLGFLGLLHLEIIKERLDREFAQEVIITNPTVSYSVKLKNGQIKIINNPSQFPDQSQIESVEQPLVKARLITPPAYIGKVMEVCSDYGGEYQDLLYLSPNQAIINFKLALAKVIVGFYDSIKGATNGYASLAYEPVGLEPADVVVLDVLVAGRREEAFSQIVLKAEADKIGRNLIGKLKSLLPPQLFKVSLQACVAGKIVAREDISSRRKDVTAKLYGGDRTRKDKLLKKQAAGKKRMAETGRLDIPANVYLEVLKS